MKYSITISLVFCVFVSFSQSTLVPLDYQSGWNVERQLLENTSDFHPEVKPYSAWSLDAFETSLPNQGGFNDTHKENRGIFDSYLEFSPRLNGSGYWQSGSSEAFKLESYVGGGVFASYKGKLMLNADILVGYNEPVRHLDRITDSLNTVPGFGVANNQGGYGFDQSTVTLSWKPGRYFELHGGRGKHFIGEGYRSLFLSDFASNYNYLRTDVHIWRIKYLALFNQMNSVQGYPLPNQPTSNKYSTMHYLSLNVTKWWSVGAFETVVWESEDSVQNRQIDINYLNPIIFFRPIEYSIGSSDNSLLGFSSTIRPFKGFTMYGQLMLDEFLLRDVVAPLYKVISPDSNVKTASWRNKQALQMGLKWHNAAGLKNSTFIAELNIVRPYTFSHGNTNQNYMHLTSPLAHPLGANFIEWVFVGAWQPKKPWNFMLTSTYARKGYSTASKHAGEDPNVSSAYLSNVPQEHGYYLLQGKLVDVANLRAYAGYTINHSWNLRVESSIQYRVERTSSVMNDAVILSLGLRTALWNQHRNL